MGVEVNNQSSEMINLRGEYLSLFCSEGREQRKAEIRRTQEHVRCANISIGNLRVQQRDLASRGKTQQAENVDELIKQIMRDFVVARRVDAIQLAHHDNVPS